jgi:hypothetical protein
MKGKLGDRPDMEVQFEYLATVYVDTHAAMNRVMLSEA